MRRFIFDSLIALAGLLVVLSFSVSAQERKAVSNESSPIIKNDTDEFYVCPMHGDVSAEKPGKCPKCGMELVKTSRAEVGEYQVQIATNPKVIKAGERFRLRLTVKHPKSGAQVKEFNIVHDMPFHLFIVSQDLAYFAHIHPQQQVDGSFAIETLLPKPGSYIVYCDIFPKSGLPQVIYKNLSTTGFDGDLF